MMDVKTFVEKFYPKDLKAFRKEGLGESITVLNDYEKTLVYVYTKEHHETLNIALLAGNPNQRISNFCYYLNKALDKLPDYVEFVYRGIELTSNEIKRYKDAFDNKIYVIEPAFVSSSQSSSIANEFSRGSVMFEIYSLHGKLIENVSFHGKKNPRNEKEVLFRSSTKFKINKIETNNNGLTFISLEEQESI